MSYTRTESTDGTFSADDDLNLIPVGRTRTTWNRPQWLHAVTGRCNLQTLFFLLDQLISGVLLAPLVIAYWRGTWVLLAGCIYPDEPYKAGWLLFSIANTGLLLLVLFQQQIEVYIRRNSFNAYCDVVVWVVCYHGYTYIAGILAVSQWQGIQLLLNYYTGNDLYSNGYAVILSKYNYVCNQSNFDEISYDRCNSSNVISEMPMFSDQCIYHNLKLEIAFGYCSINRIKIDISASECSGFFNKFV